MKCAYVHLRTVEEKGHSPEIDLEMDEAEYQRLSTDYKVRDNHGKTGGGSPVKSYGCHKVSLHLDEIEHLVDAEAFPPDRTFLE